MTIWRSALAALVPHTQRACRSAGVRARPRAREDVHSFTNACAHLNLCSEHARARAHLNLCREHARARASFACHSTSGVT